MILQLSRSNNTKRHLCLDLERICHSILNSYNRSSRPAKVVLLDILEILTKASQLFYYHQYMIPYLNKPNNIIIQLCLDDMQNMIANF